VRSLCTNQVPLGAYVALLEYNNIEGFVSPLFRRSIILRQRPRWARPGARHVCRVLRVDELRGYIDLSPPWSLSREEIVGCEDRFLRYSLVHAVVRAVSRSTGVEMRVPSGRAAACLTLCSAATAPQRAWTRHRHPLTHCWLRFSRRPVPLRRAAPTQAPRSAHASELRPTT